MCLAERDQGVVERTFNPREFAVVVKHQDAGALLLDGVARELIRTFDAHVYNARDVDPLRGHAARAVFHHVATAAYCGRGDGLRLGLLGHVGGGLSAAFDAVFDEDGDARPELEVFERGDLLYVESLAVAAPYDPYELLRYLLENIMARYGHGCMMALCCPAEREPKLMRALRDRRFQQVPREPTLWFADLSRERPPL